MEHIIKKITSHKINTVQFLHDGLKIVSCSNDKTIRIWDVLLGQQIQLLQGHLDEMISVEFSSDDSKIASCSKDNTIRIQNVSSGKQIQLLEGHSDNVTEAQFLLDGNKILSCSWDILSGKQIQVQNEDVTELQFFSNDTTIVQMIRQFNVECTDWKINPKLKGHFDSIFGIKLSLNGSKIISYSRDEII
ncbi:hypothetical protein RFI_04418 [Reticulomyxa filosa]|uniref:Uncharacterized protein n=1 Tax=Reticulomyxa filosa TaxID=46433 RepID=X6P3J4_RETFI|nr:hypothetical protein RFI_04418 [Reticulomyxa filosa]|eukprot:ETO32698.1 hypothetical protein RFI_04418 [Reticulomyxa filosa]